jgi:hypothetical protein
MKQGDPGWEEYRGCTRKHRYADEPVLGRDYFAGWARHYRCNFCQGWHLTSKPRTGSRKHEEAARDAAKHDYDICGYREVQ